MATISLPDLQALVAEIGLQPVPSAADADVLNNPIDIYHAYLADHLQTLVECDPHLVYQSIQSSNAIENGDLDIVLPKLKLPGVSPKELAGELLPKLIHPLFAAPFVDGIHIRFFFATKTLPRLLLPFINDRRDKYGILPSVELQPETKHQREKVVVEFSRPNIAREFTDAHIRSTILGAFVANIFRATNNSVVKVNYLGDWGKNLGLLALGWQKYGPQDARGEQEDLFRYIHDLYSKMEAELQPEQDARKRARDDGHDASTFERQGLLAERDATFKKMEDGEPDTIALWKKLRDITVEYYTKTYARLNINFDEYSGESEVSLNQDAVVRVETIMKEKGLSEEQNEAWIIDFDQHGTKLGSATLRDRNGSTTYFLREVATVFERFHKYSFDRMIYVVCEQDVHFRQVFKTVELMGFAEIASKLQHISFTKPASRPSASKEARLLGDILDQCESTMREAMAVVPDDFPIKHCDTVASSMGLNSLIFQELASKKGQNIGLDLSLLSLAEGETGTSLQLCYARLRAAIKDIGPQPSSQALLHIDYSSLAEPPWSDLLRLLARYPDATHTASKTLDAGTIISYLFRVTQEVTACLDEDEEDEVEGQSSNAGSTYAARAVLYESCRQVLQNGMKLLGTTPIES